MIEKWFLQDIEQQLQFRNKVCIIDPKGQFEFLLPLLDSNNYKVFKTDNKLTKQWQTAQEELFLRCEAETLYKDKPVIFYITRELNELSFYSISALLTVASIYPIPQNGSKTNCLYIQDSR